eukprot:393267_1
MPLIVSECGEYEANGCYYQENNNPPVYVQTNRSHMITEKTHTISQGYGGCYKQKVWILQKLDDCSNNPCVLYISYANNKDGSLPFASNKVEWKALSGCLPIPRVRNGMVQNNSQATKRACHSVHLSRKRTFQMFNDCDDNDSGEAMDSNCYYKQSPPLKRMKMNHNQENNGFHANQCGFSGGSGQNQANFNGFIAWKS